MNTLQLLLTKVPEGYAKSALKNISSFLLSHYPRPIQKIQLSGVLIKIVKDDVIDNKILAKEVSGYTTYYSLKKGDVVIDAGAYSGLFTIYASKKVGNNGKVLAYEPNPYNLVFLRKNIELNNIHNVTVIEKGLFDRKDKLPFDIQSVGSNIVSIHNAFYKRRTLNKIQVDTLDNEMKRLNVKKINFLKMDIEGAEINAVEGMEQTIKNNPNMHFAIASYHLVNGRMTKIFLEKFFKNKKLHVTTELNGQLTTYASLKPFSIKK